MGRSPCCDDRSTVKKGPWTEEEDEKLVSYIQKKGTGNWRALPKLAGLNRCGKSCRLRWTNYLRPDIRRGRFTQEEEDSIIKLHSVLGNKWSMIAARLPGRTDNEIKNHWNTHLRKKLLQMGIDPVTHKPRTDHLSLLTDLSQLLSLPNNSTLWNNYNPLGLQSELVKLQVLQNITQILKSTSSPQYNSLLGLLNPTAQIGNITSGGGTGSIPSSWNLTTGPLFPSEFPQGLVPASSETQDHSGSYGNSWASCGAAAEERNAFAVSGSTNSTDVLFDSHREQQSRNLCGVSENNQLPGLVSTSPGDQMLTVNDGASNTNSMDLMLNSWEKLIDDGNSDFRWEDLLNESEI